MAHAEHPNYSSKHEKYHCPKLNSGVVIKTNDNQRYATNGQTGYIFREVGRRCGQDIQEVSLVTKVSFVQKGGAAIN
jgi:aspartyl aminopeptidase